MKNRYNDFHTYLKSHFGCRVQKITIDAGLSCPNRDGTISERGCIYCNARGSGTGAHARGLTVTDQLEEGKKRLSQRYGAKKFIAYFQSFSNTYAPVNELKRLYEEALSIEDVVGLSIGTRPDCVDESVLNLLEAIAKTHLVWIEYGLQSCHEETLVRINRGHDYACFEKAVRNTQGRGIRICAHVILGLPGETRSHMMETANAIAAHGLDGVKIHLLYVIEGTRLETLYREGKYRCLEQEEYIDLVCGFLERLPPDMVIQRLTGDPHPEELVAPLWAMEKAKTLSMIRIALESRNTWQGKRYGKKY